MLKDLGIKGRVLMLTLLPTSLLTLMLGGYFTWMQLTDLHHQLQQRGEQAVQHLALLAAPALARSDAAHLKRLAEETLNQPDVRAAGFLNPERKGLAQAGPNMINQPPQTSAVSLATTSDQDGGFRDVCPRSRRVAACRARDRHSHAARTKCRDVGSGPCCRS